MTILPIPLYHGTSTLFLPSIAETGLGTRNILAEWGVHEFARSILPYVESHLAHDETWMVKAQSFRYMIEQKQTGSMNFQHGDTYLSASKNTAIRYAVNKRFGSELLSYCLDLLQELLNRNNSPIKDVVYPRFPHLFNLLNISYAPIIIAVQNISPNFLTDEHGNDAAKNIARINQALDKDADHAHVLIQQMNFRLKGTVPSENLGIWLVNVQEWNPLLPKYKLYSLILPNAEKST